MNTDNFKKLEEVLDKSQSIVIVSHVGHDMDATASALALYNYIKKTRKNKTVATVFEGKAKVEHRDFYLYDEIIFLESIVPEIYNYETIISVDVNSLPHISRFHEAINLKNFKHSICIDHHFGQIPADFEYDLSDYEASSCSQIIFKYCYKENLSLLNKSIARDLVMGIFFDTDMLRYVDRNYHMVLELSDLEVLMEKSGLDFADYELILSSLSESEFDVYKDLIINTKIHNFKNGLPPVTFSYLNLDKQFLFDSESAKNATEKYRKNILRKIIGSNWGFTVRVSRDEYIFSLRSVVGGPDVAAIARNYGGGGQPLTAGFVIKKSDPTIDTKTMIDELLEEFDTLEIKTN